MIVEGCVPCLDLESGRHDDEANPWRVPWVGDSACDAECRLAFADGVTLEEIVRLVYEGSHHSRGAIAGDLVTDLPESALWELARVPGTRARLGLTQRFVHWTCPPAVLDSMAEDPDWRIRSGVAGTTSTLAVVRALLCDDHPEVREAAVGNEHLPPTESFAFVTSTDVAARRGVLSRRFDTDLPRFVVDTLIGDPHACVRVAIAGEECFPVEWTLPLADDPVPFIRSWVAGDDRLPDHVCLALTRDPDPEVRRRLIVDGRPAVLALLVNDPVAEVRLALAGHSDAAELLPTLARDRNPHVRAVVARRKDLPTDIIDVLVADPDHSVRGVIATRRRQVPAE